MATNNEYLEKLKKQNPSLYHYFVRGMDIVKRLVEKMHEAYIVGGAVRDYLLGVEFKDIDIATSATPKELLEIFPGANTRYSELGCIEIKEDGMTFQITTFRDEQLVTTRQTKDIHYSKKLTDDVLRRDFTVNAFALASNYNVIDILNASKDIKNKIVRVIGDGKKRFREDPLRILRGFDLVSRFNFKFASSTKRAIKACRKEVASISEQKLSELLVSILSGEYAKNAIKEMAKVSLFKDIPVYHEWVVSMNRKYKYTNIDEKFALLYYLNGSIPLNTCFAKDMLQKFEELIKITKIVSEEKVTPMMVFTYGDSKVISANQILVTIGNKYKNQLKQIKKISSKLPIRSKKELNFEAEELIQMLNGYTGPRISEIMDRILVKVVNGEVLNNNSLIRQEVLKLLTEDSKKEKRQPEKVANTENMLSVHPLNKEDLPSTMPKESDVDSLKKAYILDFKNLFNSFMQEVEGYNYMSDEKKQEVAREIRIKVKASLLATNSKYKILVEKGII